MGLEFSRELGPELHGCSRVEKCREALATRDHDSGSTSHDISCLWEHMKHACTSNNVSGSTLSIRMSDEVAVNI